MNYPVPMPTPKENAKYLDNVRLNKFISEYQQMIACAMGYYGATDEQLPKRKNGNPFSIKSHPNHPCTLWAKKNRSNFLHMCRSTLEFVKEHHERGGKGHENARENVKKAMKFAGNIPGGARTPFPNCAASEELGVSYKHVPNVHLAYQLYYKDRWKLDKKEPKWEYKHERRVVRVK
jgi:hypothetical protein